MRIIGEKVVLTRDHYLHMQVPVRFWEADLTKVPDSAKKVVGKYIENLDTMLHRGIGLLLWGGNGRGKTSAAVCIAKEIRQTGAPVLFVTAEQLRQGKIDGEMFNADSTLWERATEVDCLVLDELGKEYRGKTDHTERLMDRLFRIRAGARLVTIVTTNVVLQDLKKHYNPSMLMLFQEILHPVRVDGPDMRAEKRDEIKKLLEG